MSKQLLDSFLFRSGLSVKKSGSKQVVCLCPVCGPNDHSGHLYIADAGDRLLIYCQKCNADIDTICTSVNMKTSELFESKAERVKIGSREHIYENPDGTIFGKKIITTYSDGKKGVYWLRYDGAGYNKGLDGCKAPLYHVHRLLNSEDATIVFVEGEKDVETLERMGYTSTSVPNGGSQKKWYDTFNMGLEGRSIYILTDNDEVGKNYGQFIAKHVSKLASAVYIIPCETLLSNLKEKGDISDIADQIGMDTAAEHLKAAIMSAIPYDPTRNDEDQTETTTKRSKKEAVTSDIVKEILVDMGVTIRLNLISNRFEIDGLHEKHSQMNAVNTLPVLIMDIVKKRNMNCTTQFIKDALAMIADECRYNPVETMLRTIQWDGEDRISQYIDLLGVTDEHDIGYIKKWLHQTVAMPLNDEINPKGADGVLTFLGDQGTGKTTAFRVLAVRPEWFCEGARIDMDKKDTLIRATGRWICEIGEADDTTKKEQSALKSFLTSTVDEIRFPYAVEAIRKPRRTSFCATVNAERFLPADDGSRRWWIVHTGNIDYKVLLNLPIEWFIQVWAQVYKTMYIPNPQGFRLTNIEKTILQEENLKFQKILPGEQEILDRLNFEISEKNWKWWRTSNLRENLRIYNVTAAQLGRALSKIARNYPKIRTKTVKKVTSYFLPPFFSDGPED